MAQADTIEHAGALRDGPVIVALRLTLLGHYCCDSGCSLDQLVRGVIGYRVSSICITLGVILIDMLQLHGSLVDVSI